MEEGKKKFKIIPSIKIGIIVGSIGCIMSFLNSYFLVPMPVSKLSHAIGSGITGLISAFMGGFMGLLIYFKKSK